LSLNVRWQKAFLFVNEVLLRFSNFEVSAFFLFDGIGAVLVWDIHAFIGRDWLAQGFLNDLQFGHRCANVDGFVGGDDVHLLRDSGGFAVGLDRGEVHLFLDELAFLPRHLFAFLLPRPHLVAVIVNLPACLAVEAGLVLAVRDLLDVLEDDWLVLTVEHVHGLGVELALSVAIPPSLQSLPTQLPLFLPSSLFPSPLSPPGPFVAVVVSGSSVAIVETVVAAVIRAEPGRGCSVTSGTAVSRVQVA